MGDMLACVKARSDPAKFKALGCTAVPADSDKAANSGLDFPLDSPADCWSEETSLQQKKMGACLTAKISKGPGSLISPLEDLPYVRLACCGGETLRFAAGDLPDDGAEGLVGRWTAALADHSIMMVDAYDRPAAAQAAAAYGMSNSADYDRKLVHHYQLSVAALGERMPPLKLEFEEDIASTFAEGKIDTSAYPHLRRVSHCFVMHSARNDYRVCNAYIVGTSVVSTYVSKGSTLTTDDFSNADQFVITLFNEEFLPRTYPAGN